MMTTADGFGTIDCFPRPESAAGIEHCTLLKFPAQHKERDFLFSLVAIPVSYVQNSQTDIYQESWGAGSYTFELREFSAPNQIYSLEYFVGDIPIILGDVNLDGIVNLLDGAPFVALVSSGGFQDEADINQDGVINLLDVGPFVGLLAGN